jgi:hypothetical protein
MRARRRKPRRRGGRSGGAGLRLAPASVDGKVCLSHVEPASDHQCRQVADGLMVSQTPDCALDGPGQWRAARRRVRAAGALATPATLLALLRTVAYAFQQEKVAADAQAIAQLGRELYDRLCTLLGHIDKVSRCINTLVGAQAGVVGSMESRVLPTARKFSEV